MGSNQRVQEIDASNGVYRVQGSMWIVGSRYRLREHVGSGAYGDVCKATYVETKQMVALKRITNIFQNPVLAARVLREVCIMRRLKNPYVLNLLDVFTVENFELKHCVDLYIATEFATGGDIGHFKKYLEDEVVKKIMFQLLEGVAYLHSCQVWHRDIKSENILLTSSMQVKITDFGLSRSVALEENWNHCSTTASEEPMLRRQYTKAVVTPCFRAQEVIMSDGYYTSAIDIWSVGCIFWELLTASLGKPLFAVGSEPRTSLGSVVHANDGNSELAEQLDVIFNVIGTPCWKDIEKVPSESWRVYLKHIPGRPGNLRENLRDFIEEDAMDLLHQMLTFDPARRCTAKEALAHTYFKGIETHPIVSFTGQFQCGSCLKGGLWNDNDPVSALGRLEMELENWMNQQKGGPGRLEFLLNKEIEKQQEEIKFQASSCKHLTMFLDLNQTVEAQDVDGHQDPLVKSKGKKKTSSSKAKNLASQNLTSQTCRTSTRLASKLYAVRVDALKILIRRSQSPKKAHAPGLL